MRQGRYLTPITYFEIRKPNTAAGIGAHQLNALQASNFWSTQYCRDGETQTDHGRLGVQSKNRLLHGCDPQKRSFEEKRDTNEKSEEDTRAANRRAFRAGV